MQGPAALPSSSFVSFLLSPGSELPTGEQLHFCKSDTLIESLSFSVFRDRKDSSTVLDASKYIALVKTLSKNGKVEGKFLDGC